MMTKADEVAAGILSYLKTEKALELLPEIILSLQGKLSEIKNPVQIESAQELSETEKADISDIIRNTWKISAPATYVVNPDLIGGMRVSIGDRVVDLSVKAKLQSVYEQI